MNISIFGKVEYVHEQSYTTNKGNLYNVKRIGINNENGFYEVTAREKALRLCHSVTAGDLVNVSVNLLCRKTAKTTFISLDITNIVNLTYNAK